MAATVIYHTTSRKALELLRDSGFEPRTVEYLKTPPGGTSRVRGTRDELVSMIAGIDVRSGRCPRLDAMAEHPILIERPFVVTAKGTRLARPIETVREIL
jgi:arsenate reductase